MNKKIGTVIAVIMGAVLSAAIACGTSATAAPPPGDPPPIELEEVEAPIEGVELVIAESNPPQYLLNIVSGLPSGCAKFNDYEVVRDGTAIEVTVTNLRPAPGQVLACTAIYGYHDGTVNLGSDFDPNETYVVSVNGLVSEAFVGMDDRALGMVVKESPIEEWEILPSGIPGKDKLVIISRLPLGSSCSEFNGYRVERPAPDEIEVMLTHREVVDPNTPCTADLPAILTEIPLELSLEPGENITFTVNGEAAQVSVAD